MKVTARATEALLTTPPTSTLHSVRSVDLSGLLGISDWSGLFVAAADMTIILLGISEDNEPRETTGGRDNANLQILSKHVH